MDHTFSGAFTPRLDEKGRLLLPSRFRPQFKEGLVLTKGTERCVFLYPSATFTEVAARLHQAEQTAPHGEARRAASVQLRQFSGNGYVDAPDKQGRVTVPAVLRDYAHLDREVVVVGVFDRVELWDRPAYDSYQASTDEDYSQGGP